MPFRRLHCHDDIEIGVNEHHPVTAIFGGERLVLPPNYLVVFWAARPHGPIETTPGGWADGIHIPLFLDPAMAIAAGIDATVVGGTRSA